MNKPKRIFIVGHLGAGKALLGKALAEKLNWQFIDANLALERQVGRELNDIIGNQNETYLKTLSEILSNHIKQNNIIVATDDCIVLSEQNTKSLSSEFVIYLKVNTAEQLKRMSDGPLPLLPMADKKHSSINCIMNGINYLRILPH